MGVLYSVGENSDYMIKITSCNFQPNVFIVIYLFIYYLQLVRHPVAGVISCYVSTDYEVFTVKFRYGGPHGKHVVATWKYLEPSQHLLKDPGKPKKKKSLCRDGRSQALPGTDF